MTGNGRLQPKCLWTEPVLVDWSEMAREMKKTHLVAWLQGHQLILKIFTELAAKSWGVNTTVAAGSNLKGFIEFGGLSRNQKLRRQNPHWEPNDARQCIALGHFDQPNWSWTRILTHVTNNSCFSNVLGLQRSTVSSRMPSGFVKVLWSAFGQSSLFG